MSKTLPAAECEFCDAPELLERIEAEAADHWAPIPLRWRHVLPGDVIVGKAKPLMVRDVRPDPGGLTVRVYGFEQPYYVDADEVMQVLVPAAERTAIASVREQLGGQIIGRVAS